jgi:hypothetical protein
MAVGSSLGNRRIDGRNPDHLADWQGKEASQANNRPTV